MPCPYTVTVSCHRRHAVAHIVAAQIPTVTRSHNRRRPVPGWSGRSSGNVSSPGSNAIIGTGTVHRVMSPSSCRGGHRCVQIPPHRYRVIQPSPSRVRMVGATIGKCLVTGIECDHRDRYGTPCHVTVVTPWRTSLPRKSPPLPGHTTVIGPHRVRHQTTE